MPTTEEARRNRSEARFLVYDHQQEVCGLSRADAQAKITDYLDEHYTSIE